MPVYTVTGPDGKSYKVNAPEGTSQKRIMDWVQNKVAQSRKASEPTTGDNIHGALSSFLDGAIPGAGGVASGLVGAVMNPSDMKKGFTEARKVSEQREERFKQDHPYLGAAATGAGFVGSLFVPVTKVGLLARGAEAAAVGARAALGGRVLNGAANGALYGAAGGALSSHAGSVGDFARDTAKGALLGGAAGGAVPVAARVAAPVATPIAAAAGRRLAPVVEATGRSLPGRLGQTLERSGQAMSRQPAETRASRYIGGKMEQAGMDPAAMMTELNRRHAMGVPAAPADTHELLRDAYGSAARRPGPATAAVRRSIDTRQREMSGRVSEHIGDTLGPVTNVEQQAQGLRRQAEEAARPLYDISDAQPIPLVRELRELFDRPSGREAMQIAGRELQDRGANLTEMGLVQGHDGVFSLGQAPTMPFYDHMKSVLDQGIYAGNAPFAPMEASRFGRGARDIRSRLLNIMDGDGSGPRIPDRPGSDLVPTPGASQTPADALAGLPSPPPALGARESLPVPYEAPGGAVDMPLDQGQRLYPETGPQASAGQTPLGSAIPDNGLNPYWRPARDAYAGPTQNRKALELGDQMARDGATDAVNRMENMTTGSQRDFFRLGHRTGLSDDVRKLGDYGNAARRVDGNLDARDAISAVHGDEAAGNLFDRLAAEHEGYQTFAAVRGNSMTAGREASDEIARQEQALADTGRGLWAAAQGRGIDAARHFGSAFSGEPALTNRVNELTAEGLGNTDLAGVRQMLGNVRRTRVMDRAADERSGNLLSQTAKTIGSRTGAGLATPDDDVLLGYRQRPDGGFDPVFGPAWSEPDEGLIPAGL